MTEKGWTSTLSLLNLFNTLKRLYSQSQNQKFIIMIKENEHSKSDNAGSTSPLTPPRLAQRNEDVLTYAFATHQQKFFK